MQLVRTRLVGLGLIAGLLSSFSPTFHIQIVRAQSADTSVASVNGKYSDLIQVVNCPSNSANYGEFYDWGYWSGTSWCGQSTQPGYWVWVNPDWYIWRNVGRSEELQKASEIARKLREEYPGWKERLPNCPCTEEEIRQSPEFEGAYTGLETYHPGAESSYRSANPTTYTSAATGEKLEPGQQCTYAGGRLITGGAGAGTPDAFSPNSNSIGFSSSHIKWDVDTWKVMSLQEYHQTWTPNNGNSCPVNIVPKD